MQQKQTTLEAELVYLSMMVSAMMVSSLVERARMVLGLPGSKMALKTCALTQLQIRIMKLLTEQRRY